MNLAQGKIYLYGFHDGLMYGIQYGARTEYIARNTIDHYVCYLFAREAYSLILTLQAIVQARATNTRAHAVLYATSSHIITLQNLQERMGVCLPLPSTRIYT